MKTQKSGKLGEDAACKLLKKKHYTILTRNYRKRVGEIDIVAQKGNRIAFVEVKTRTDVTHGMPGEAVTYGKQQKIIKTAKYYIAEHQLDAVFAFDVIEVRLEDGKILSVNHIEDAFLA